MNRIILQAFILCLALLISCEDLNKDALIPDPPTTQVFITSLEEEPFLNDLLDVAGFEVSPTEANSRSNNEGTILQVDEILKVLQSDSSHYTYTFVLNDHTAGFANLVLEETSDGNYLAFILRYEFEGNFDFLEYTGSITRFDLTGNLLTKLQFENGELIAGANDSHGKGMQSSTCLTGVTKHEECVEWGAYKNALGTQETCLRKALVITMEYGDCSTYTPTTPADPAPTFGGGTTISAPGSGSSGSTPPEDIDAGTGIKPIPGYKPVKPVVVIPERWDESIDDSGLKPCMKTILTDIKNLKNGSIGQIIQKFSGNTPNYNWSMKEGALKPGSAAETNPPGQFNKTTRSITTTFDSEAWKNATDLSWARTILHESIHAYLSVYFSTDPKKFISDYPGMVQDYGTINNWNGVHHEEFARSLVNSIADALEEYGQIRGYKLSRQFYEDMSWGGLQNTSTFKALSETDKSRILDVIAIEATGRDFNGGSKKQLGKKAGC